MGRSPGFGYITTYFIRPFQTRFRCGSGFSTLTLHVIMTRRFILQEARRHPLTGSDSLWAHGFRNYFTPLPGCFSPFPHGTGSLSVTREYLALGVCRELPSISPMTTPEALLYTPSFFHGEEAGASGKAHCSCVSLQPIMLKAETVRKTS